MLLLLSRKRNRLKEITREEFIVFVANMILIIRLCIFIRIRGFTIATTEIQLQQKFLSSIYYYDKNYNFNIS